MKTLSQYIFEQEEKHDIIRLNMLECVYDAVPNTVCIYYPGEVDESAIQEYINDKFLANSPVDDSQTVKDILGINKSNISDAYFEYDKFERLGESENESITSQIEKDIKSNKVQVYKYEEETDKKIYIYKLSNFRMVITFDNFDILNTSNQISDAEDTEHIKPIIDDMFTALESNDKNNYAIILKYNSYSTQS
jgi:hypothetical protein